MHNNSYKPLSRPLFIYAKRSSFARPEVRSFIGYIFNNEKAIAQRADFIALTPASCARRTTSTSRR